jgi:hypothetical protein
MGASTEPQPRLLSARHLCYSGKLLYPRTFGGTLVYRGGTLVYRRAARTYSRAPPAPPRPPARSPWLRTGAGGGGRRGPRRGGRAKLYVEKHAYKWRVYKKAEIAALLDYFHAS